MRLDIDWGKSVRRSAVPYTPDTAATNSQCFRPCMPSMTSESFAGVAPLPAVGVVGPAAPEPLSNAPLIVISPPSINCSLLASSSGLRPEVLQRVIDLTAKFVAVDGAALEKVSSVPPPPLPSPSSPFPSFLSFPSSAAPSEE